MAVTFLRHSKTPGKAFWIIDWWPEGRKGPRRRRTVEGTREEAELVEQSIREAAGKGRIKKSTLFLTLEAALPEYLRWHKMHRADRTHKDVRQSLPGLMKVFGKLTVAEIRPSHITDFIARRPNRRRANQKDIHYLRAMISWMVDQNYAAPLTFKPMAPRYNRPLPKVPSPDEVKAVLAEIEDPVKKALVYLMWTTGVRISSALALRWEDISWHRNTFLIRTKGDRALLLPLPAEFIELMYERRQQAGWVFVNPKTQTDNDPNGQPYKSIIGQLKAASRRAGLGYVLSHHKLRHAYATDTLEATGDLRLVQRALGHRDIQTTTIYTHVTDNRIAEAQDRVRALREKNGVYADTHGIRNTPVNSN